jgi:hypothetical protein
VVVVGVDGTFSARVILVVTYGVSGGGLPVVLPALQLTVQLFLGQLHCEIQGAFILPQRGHSQPCYGKPYIRQSYVLELPL